MRKSSREFFVGTTGPVTALERRRALLDEREDQILALLKEKTSVRAISMLVGMPFDYCKTMCLELVKKHGLDYDSKEAAVADRDKMPVGVTSDSDLVRHRLADLMYDARQRRSEEHTSELQSLMR